MSTRVLVTPAPFGQSGTAVAILSHLLRARGGRGRAGTGFATAWPGGGGGGVVIPNQGNGAIWLYWLSGTSRAGITQVLVGQMAGSTGAVLAATVEQMTLPATSSGYLGPWSPVTYNQAAPTVVTYASPINATALTAAAQGCVVIDFTTSPTCVSAPTRTSR